MSLLFAYYYNNLASVALCFLGDVSQKDEDINVGFVLYNNDKFFESKIFEDPLHSNRKVISGNPGKGSLDSIQLSMNNTVGDESSLDPAHEVVALPHCVFLVIKCAM